MAYIFSGAYVPLSCKLIEQVGKSTGFIYSPGSDSFVWFSFPLRKHFCHDEASSTIILAVLLCRCWSGTAGRGWKKSPGYWMGMNLQLQVTKKHWYVENQMNNLKLLSSVSVYLCSGTWITVYDFCSKQTQLLQSVYMGLEKPASSARFPLEEEFFCDLHAEPVFFFIIVLFCIFPRFAHHIKLKHIKS